jgi:phosphoribosylformimino-5-aminoimidazole carboxamide ribotide isomerase
MKIFPAIDLKNGKCVRLTKGDFTKMKIYSENPIRQAEIFFKEGFTNLHIVDLDGALTGNLVNLGVLLLNYFSFATIFNCFLI